MSHPSHLPHCASMTPRCYSPQQKDRHPAEAFSASSFGWLWAWLARLWVVAGSAVGGAVGGRRHGRVRYVPRGRRRVEPSNRHALRRTVDPDMAAGCTCGRHWRRRYCAGYRKTPYLLGGWVRRADGLVGNPHCALGESCTAGGKYVWGWTTRGDARHYLGDGTQLWRVALCGNRRTWWGAAARLAAKVLGQATPGRADHTRDNTNDSDLEPSGADPPACPLWTHSRRRIADAPWAQTLAGVSDVFMGLPLPRRGRWCWADGRLPSYIRHPSSASLGLPRGLGLARMRIGLAELTGPVVGKTSARPRCCTARYKPGEAGRREPERLG